MKVNYKPVGDNLPTVLSTAVAGGNPPDMADIAQPGLVKQFVDKGALKPITYARKALRGELRAVVDRARHVQRQDLRPRLQGEQQVDRLVQRSTPSRPRASRRRRPGRSSPRPRTRSRRRACRRTRSAAPTAGRSPTCSRTSTSARPGPAKYSAALGAQDQVDRPVGHRGAEDDGAGVRQLGQHGRRHLGRGADGLPDVGQQRLPEPAEGARW